MEYKDDLTQRAAALIIRQTSCMDIDPADVFADIDWSKEADNDDYFARLVRAKVIRTKDITAAKRKERARGRLISILGTNPNTPYQFVKAQAGKLGLDVNWKGSMILDGEHVLINTLKRVMRMAAVELEMDWDRADIDDATEQFYDEAMAARPAALNAEFGKRQPFDWIAFAKAFFVTDNDAMPAAFVASVLQKFIHQTRLKLIGLPVQHHLMPVLHGPQGCGKTYLMEKMLAPIAEAVSWSNFDQVTDDRNIALWSSLVIVLDEMAKAAKADVETIKHVITAEALDRRPMYSNRTVQVPNRAVLIGASNHRLDELIKDETGNRRFVELIYRRADGARIEDFDFHAMWSSVQPNDADPMANWRDHLRTVQADYAVLGPVEDWLVNTDLSGVFTKAEMATSDLYENFCTHRRAVTPGHDYQARTQLAFASELRRVVEQNPAHGIRKVHTRTGNRWRWDHFAAKPKLVLV